MIKTGIVDADIIVHSVLNSHDRNNPEEKEPLSHVLHSIKLMIDDKLSRSGVRQYRSILSGGRNTNFRYEVFPGYKGSRSADRPTYYNEAREYISTYYNGEVVEGEADDAIGLILWDDHNEAVKEHLYYGGDVKDYLVTCVLTTDKDINMIPGWHFSWSKNALSGPTYTDLATANKSFYKQLLTGDRVDDIPGLSGIGPVTAERILKRCESPEAMLDMCIKTYAEKSVPLEAMLVYADLLWIARERGVRGNRALQHIIPLTEMEAAYQGYFKKRKPKTPVGRVRARREKKLIVSSDIKAV